MIHIAARNRTEAHRALLLGGVAQPPVRYNALYDDSETAFVRKVGVHVIDLRRFYARQAFREAWRAYIARTTVAAEYAIAEEKARQQMEAAREAAP